MVRFGVIMIVVALAGCAPTRQYRGAMQSFRYQNSLCWHRTTDVPPDQCGSYEDARKAQDACITSSSRKYAFLGDGQAVSDIRDCMDSNGWRLIRNPDPIEIFAPESVPPLHPMCSTEYGVEKCENL